LRNPGFLVSITVDWIGRECFCYNSFLENIIVVSLSELVKGMLKKVWRFVGVGRNSGFPEFGSPPGGRLWAARRRHRH